jgi:hypothetical protein
VLIQPSELKIISHFKIIYCWWSFCLENQFRLFVFDSVKSWSFGRNVPEHFAPGVWNVGPTVQLRRVESSETFEDCHCMQMAKRIGQKSVYLVHNY